MSSTEKKEGVTQTCKCGTKLICVKIIKEWQGKTETKLQWQNQSDHKPHFKFAGPGKFDCVIPKKDDSKTNDDYLKKKQAELQQTSKLTPQQTESINEEIDTLQEIEKLITSKLPTDTNPQKIGLYIKLIRNSMDEK